MDTIAITITYGLLQGVVIALTELFKRAGIRKKWLPGISVFLGIVITFLARLPLGEMLLMGCVLGLSASGLYDFGKLTFKK